MIAYASNHPSLRVGFFSPNVETGCVDTWDNCEGKSEKNVIHSS